MTAISISHPQGTEVVDTEMGQNTVAASGNIAFDHDLFSLEAVHGTIYTGSPPGNNEYGSYPQASTVDPGTGDFSFPSLGNAQCNAAGTVSNQFKIWCVLMDKATTEMIPVTKTGTFLGQCETQSAKSKGRA